MPTTVAASERVPKKEIDRMMKKINPVKYKFVPLQKNYEIYEYLSRCERCCFWHTGNYCRPCISQNRTDGKDGYYITTNH